MPIAVTGGSERFELKTLPGAYVVIRRMNHGEKLTRGAFSDKMKFNASKGKKDVQGEIDMMQRSVALWEWTNLITDHNLEAYINPSNPDLGVRLLNLKDVKDISAVDANVAEEVSTYIGKVNNFEDDLDDSETDLGKSA